MDHQSKIADNFSKRKYVRKNCNCRDRSNHNIELSKRAIQGIVNAFQK